MLWEGGPVMGVCTFVPPSCLVGLNAPHGFAHQLRVSASDEPFYNVGCHLFSCAQHLTQRVLPTTWDEAKRAPTPPLYYTLDRVFYRGWLRGTAECGTWTPLRTSLTGCTEGGTTPCYIFDKV